MLARERVELLLDEDSPFIEICPFAGLGQGDYNPGAVVGMGWLSAVRVWFDIHIVTFSLLGGTGGTVVGGVGVVAGVACVVLANVPTINGGTINPPSMVRSGRLAQVQ